MIVRAAVGTAYPVGKADDASPNLTGRGLVLKGSFIYRTAIAAFCAATLYTVPVFADSRVSKLSQDEHRFPFEIVLDNDTCERKCYTGYGKKYKNGYAITPDTSFEVVALDPEVESSALRIEIDMIYQNDSGKGSKVEKITTYDYGDVEVGDGSYYSFLTERSMENLEERDRLYSTPQRSLRLTLTYAPEESEESKQTDKQYYQVCTDDELMYYIENAAAGEEEETEPETPAVYYAEQ